MTETTKSKGTTRAEWQKLYSDELEKRDRAEVRYVEANNKVSTLEKRNKEVVEQFADLKQRLLAAEQSNQFMRGYLARVQEDDTVREELLTIGDPEGQQQMVPKRKSMQFERPDDFSVPRADRSLGYASFDNDRERHKPKHWITY